MMCQSQQEENIIEANPRAKIIQFQYAFVKTHIEELISLDRSVFKKYGAWAGKNFLKRIPGKEQLSKIAVLGDTIIGYVICSAYCGKGHIHRLAVHSLFQKMQIGTTLIAAFSKECLMLGLQEITLETSSRNITANEFYRKIGFKELSGKKLEQYLSQKGKISQVDVYRRRDASGYLVFSKSAKMYKRKGV